jgi:hypothetical protein
MRTAIKIRHQSEKNLGINAMDILHFIQGILIQLFSS